MAPAQAEGEARHERGDERYALDPGRVRERVRHRHRAAQRVPDQRGLGDAHRVEESVERAGEVPEPVRGARLGRAAEPRQIDGEHRGPGGQGVDRVPPRLRKAAEAVQEHDRGTAAGDYVVEGEPVDLAAPQGDVRHGR